MISKQHLRLQPPTAKSFELIQQSKWQDIIQFILDTTEGKEEVKSIGIDLLYTAVQYRAPVDLIIFLFDIIERESEDHRVTLDPTLLRKALYHPTTSNDTNVCIDQYSRRWESNERMNVASFLSEKIQYNAHRRSSLVN